MAWTRRWRIDSKRRLLAVAGLISHTLVSESAPLELILRTERKEKSPAQRALFHAVCGDLAPLLGLAPAETKQLIKEQFYGVETKVVLGVPRRFTQASEDSDREEYSRLIDFAYQLGAEQGFNIPDRRPG